MLSFRRTRGDLGRTDLNADRRRPGFQWRRMGDTILVLAAVLMVVYAFSVAAQALEGFTMVRSTPAYSIRLQVIDASGEANFLAEALGDIQAIADETLALEIVETTAFDLRDVTQSYVVSRQEDCRATCILAERLGLEPDDVEHQPLANNSRQVTATLVLGKNGVNPVTVKSQEEET